MLSSIIEFVPLVFMSMFNGSLRKSVKCCMERVDLKHRILHCQSEPTTFKPLLSASVYAFSIPCSQKFHSRVPPRSSSSSVLTMNMSLLDDKWFGNLAIDLLCGCFCFVWYKRAPDNKTKSSWFIWLLFFVYFVLHCKIMALYRSFNKQ